MQTEPYSVLGCMSVKQTQSIMLHWREEANIFTLYFGEQYSDFFLKITQKFDKISNFEKVDKISNFGKRLIP